MNLLNEANKICGVGDVSIMQKESCIVFMRIYIEMIAALGIE